MKFKKIKMTNFMRYKDDNELVFSCNPESNVTIVLGNNTFGKTTIAQAFRWVLYGEVINTQYDKSKNVSFLNNEVLEEMDANSREKVEVTIEVEENNYVFEFTRQAEFVRKFPKLEARQTAEKLYMRTFSSGKWSEFISDTGDRNNKGRGKVTDQINKLFPKELSNYFLFDGERWSDEKTSRKDIKESINTIMGISALSSMKYHLKEYGTSGKGSVIRTLKSKSVGNDLESEKLLKDQRFCVSQIEECEKKIEAASDAVETYKGYIQKSEEILNGNKKIEDEQKRAVQLEREIKLHKDRIERDCSNFVSYYSREAYKSFVAPLVSEAKKVLSNVDIDGKGIPNVNDETIYYLLEHKECLCGCEICEGSKEYNALIKLLNVVPPKVIGTEVAYFQEKMDDYVKEGDDAKKQLIELADSIEFDKAELDDLEDELYHVNKRIDGKINFGQERIRLQGYRRKLEDNNEIIRKSEKNIEDYNRRIENLDTELESLAEKNEKTLRYRRILAYAEELSKEVENNLKIKEEPLFDELNEKIKNNYSQMFTEKEKYAQLGEDYKLHLYYKGISSEGDKRTYEETNLSEGEKIACNFVFIVSILELAQEKRKVKEDEDMVVSLPLVLDAPFSKLSGENTGLIASVLPKAADQVIIFMLDKDLSASGLDAYTDSAFKYRVYKDSDATSSSIVKEN